MIPTRRFTLDEITSGLPDDSREEDEPAEYRRLRDLRGRVKAARAASSSAPGAEETLRYDWREAAHFYARLGISEAMYRRGVPASTSLDFEDSDWDRDRVVPTGESL